MDKLKGFVDIHIHTSPDILDRKLDDISAAKSARDAGMTAIVIKSHITLTADRAAIARRWQKAKAKNESVWIRQRLLDDK